MITVDEKAMPRPLVTDAERAAIAASGGGRVADKLYRDPAQDMQDTTEAEADKDHEAAMRALVDAKEKP
jgi:hypothetical protein